MKVLDQNFIGRILVLKGKVVRQDKKVKIRGDLFIVTKDYINKAVEENLIEVDNFRLLCFRVGEVVMENVRDYVGGNKIVNITLILNNIQVGVLSIVLDDDKKVDLSEVYVNSIVKNITEDMVPDTSKIINSINIVTLNENV